MESSLKYKLYDKAKVLCRKIRKNEKLKVALCESKNNQIVLLRSIVRFLK